MYNEETFALVVKLNIVLVLLSLATNQDWELHQLDKYIYINKELEEDMYMEILLDSNLKEKKELSLIKILILFQTITMGVVHEI